VRGLRAVGCANKNQTAPLTPTLSPTLTRRGEGEGLRRYAAVVLVLILLALSLAACGKRNLPTPPEGEELTYPRQYPRV
jgi:hypothetical protein